MADMLQAGQAAGLLEMGISDHMVLTRDSSQLDLSFACPLERLGEYAAAVAEAAKSVTMPVRLGVEIDFFPDTPAMLAEAIGDLPVDYLIGSVHFVDTFPVDRYLEDWRPLDQDQIDEVFRGYWQRMTQLAESRLFDFVGHLDLAKKYRFTPSCDLTGQIRSTLDAIAESGLAIELNTAGWDKPCAAPYPTLDLLCDCRRREIPLVLSDDAHHTRDIGRHFDQARMLLAKAGYSKISRFNQRIRQDLPLDAPRAR
jgi:histidinol-phosphatase (PHP family)